MYHNLQQNIVFEQVSGPVAAGTTTINTTSVDMEGYEGVAFVVNYGVLSTGNTTTIHAEQSSDNSTFANLAGTGIVVAQGTDADDKAVLLDIAVPQKQYVRCSIDRATANATINSVTAIRYRAAKKPVTQGSNVLYSELHVSPDEGTI